MSAPASGCKQNVTSNVTSISALTLVSRSLWPQAARPQSCHCMHVCGPYLGVGGSEVGDGVGLGVGEGVGWRVADGVGAAVGGAVGEGVASGIVGEGVVGIGVGEDVVGVGDGAGDGTGVGLRTNPMHRTYPFRSAPLQVTLRGTRQAVNACTGLAPWRRRRRRLGSRQWRRAVHACMAWRANELLCSSGSSARLCNPNEATHRG